MESLAKIGKTGPLEPGTILELALLSEEELEIVNLPVVAQSAKKCQSSLRG